MAIGLGPLIVALVVLILILAAIRVFLPLEARYKQFVYLFAILIFVLYIFGLI